MPGTNMPKVSIRIMTFNSEKFISRAIESCLNQSFQDFEICIADDASTDHTVEIVKAYQEKYPDKIKLVIQQINMGRYSLAINGNAGRNLCSGEYLALLDGDEFMLPFRLENQVDFLDNNPDCIAVSHEKKFVDFATGTEIQQPATKRQSNRLSTKNLILHGNTFHNCYMMRNTGAMADHSLKVMADWHFIIRLSMSGKLGYQEEQMTVKFWHDENVTRKRNKQFAEDRLITLALLEYRYPELLKYIKVRRARHYLSEIRNGDWRYLPPLLSNPLALFWAFTIKYI
jgi:glycosyltransferase involved in cell wall biosynthesis